MAFDPVLLAHTKQWLRLATEDLAYAAHALTAQPPFSKDALFHCQQAAEKGLRAFLTWRDIRFRGVHDLDEIGQQCAGVDPTLAELAVRVRPLTAFASHLRYPGAEYDATLEEAESALGLAREVWAAVSARMPEEALP
ncbi:MAG: HEPN domain-containing protein [Bryobacteraceae bacterium]|nr:HEPN domain-containing protein [Bryobacteraceae bacterium]